VSAVLAALDEPRRPDPVIKRDREGRVIYRPDGDTLVRFMRDNSRVRIIRGPIRSGTSSMCCMEIWRRACEQAPVPDGRPNAGLRMTRWFIVRNTYAQLEQSTLKTWLQWFPEADFGRLIRGKPMVHRMRKGDVWCEVVFLALDKADEVNKLRSTEWTGGWFNELEYQPKEIFDEGESRIGYFPPVMDGGCTWSGVLGDMNAPSEDNWVVALTGEVAPPDDLPENERAAYVWPESWAYFKQPPGLLEVFGADGKTVTGYRLNPQAENLTWIPRVNGKPLYLETIKGKTKRWIDSRIMNRITPPVGGQPVWPMFVEENHIALQMIPWRPDYPIYVGMDFGRQPAVVLGQRINDRWMIIDEMTGYDMGATTFAPKVVRWWSEKYPNAKMIVHGDPKGADKNQSDEQSAFDVWRALGVNVQPAPVKGNNIKTRLEAVEHALQSAPNGYIGFLVSPVCRVLKMALAGGYRFKEGDNIREEPDKNKYSHIADALQYLLIGGGEGRVMIGRDRDQRSEPVRARVPRRSLRRVH
jgi:hypothetical protein